MAISALFSLQAPAETRPDSAPGVPQAWMSYAQFVGRQFQAWLGADDEIAFRFHKFLEDRLTDTAKLTPTDKAPEDSVTVRAWIDDGGAVSRIEFPSLGDPSADEDLRRLLSRSRLSQAPPPDMRQPLILRLRLDFAT